MSLSDIPTTELEIIVEWFLRADVVEKANKSLEDCQLTMLKHFSDDDLSDPSHEAEEELGRLVMKATAVTEGQQTKEDELTVLTTGVTAGSAEWDAALDSTVARLHKYREDRVTRWVLESELEERRHGDES